MGKYKFARRQKVRQIQISSICRKTKQKKKKTTHTHLNDQIERK